MEKRIYRLADGRLWNTASAGFIAKDSVQPEDAPVIDLVSASGESSEAYLVRTLMFYGYPLGDLSPELALAGTDRDAAKEALLRQLEALDALYLTPRTMAGLAVNDATALARYEEHEAKAAPLRALLEHLTTEDE